jgi:hypothetical protein
MERAVKDWLQLLLHGVESCLPIGLLLSTLFAPARSPGVDFRQWFGDTDQLMPYSDDSRIGPGAAGHCDRVPQHDDTWGRARTATCVASVSEVGRAPYGA